ncbi:MAG: hypothetical protein D6717_09800 [Gammaproteobacteria bacterium]|nr:MAG: hypothetical protein D6717_09800 [Gammaproteobacteria bacterium]
MRAIITLCNHDNGRFAVQTDRGFCVLQLRGDHDIDEGDVLEGDFSRPGIELFKNLTQVEELQAEVLEPQVTPFTADRMVKQG